MRLTKKQVILPAIVVGALFLAPSAKASPTSGELKQQCASSKDTEIAFCYGYITGWVDGLNGANIVAKDGKVLKIVFADGITVGQVGRVFVKYITEHPEFENKLATDKLPDALFESKLMGVAPVALEAKSN